MDVISLTKRLLAFNTINPPGNEEGIAEFTGEILKNHGFRVNYFPFGENRLHLVAEKGFSSGKHPIVLSGHFDTVPLGNEPWNVDPFEGQVREGKIWGRGSSDMKGSLAAMIMAAIRVFDENPPEGGVRIVFTAGEELGCLGVSSLVKEKKFHGEAGAIIVGEPTANHPVTGHKGAIYLRMVTSGKTAHSSMPELGVNAIFKAAKAITRISEFRFEAENDLLLGYPTINVGMITGGMNINSVPDHAEFTVDIRTTTKTDHGKILEKLAGEIGGDAAFEILVDLKPVFTPETDPFIQVIYDVCGIKSQSAGFPKALPYLTDGAVLQRFYNDAPCVILGPGQPEMAHRTDEYCYINNLEKSIDLYKNIILRWNH